MCMYALQRESSVHYPQPTVYHPESTKGIRNNDPKNAVNAYWIKHEGEFHIRCMIDTATMTSGIYLSGYIHERKVRQDQPGGLS